MALPLHLLRLVSPALPVGGFSYSRGLETAVAAGTVRRENAGEWILGTLRHALAPLDGALFLRLLKALERGDAAEFARWNDLLSAGRESREMQLEDRRMGESLLTLLRDLGVAAAAEAPEPLTYPAAFAIAAHHWRIAPEDALAGLLWSIAEAQVAAAIRLIPIGHTDGQRILVAAVPVIEACLAETRARADEEIGNVAMAMAMASAWHETQTTRLFRS